MSIQYHLGQRLSFEGALCSVRYVGPVEGTQKNTIWLGVEWDDPTRGKHSGEHHGKRYFHCLSTSQAVASFVRSSRPHDPPQSFIAVLRSKYGAKRDSGIRNGRDGDLAGQSQAASIVISGKTVEEVGFDKVNQRLASFQNLRIVLLDGLCLRAANSDGEELKGAQDEIEATCPSVVELDLSRNLLEEWQSVADICQPLKRLKILKVNGNRFRSFTRLEQLGVAPFRNIQELSLEDCLMDWGQVSSVLQITDFPNLRFLSLSGNSLSKLAGVVKSSLVNLTELKLDFNDFASLSDLYQLNTFFPRLMSLSLQNDKISSVTRPASAVHAIFPTIVNLNLSRNEVATWSFFDDLSWAMPALRALQANGNPLFGRDMRVDMTTSSQRGPMPPSSSLLGQNDSASDTGSMAVIARLGNITSLNYSHITPQERMNAELYYLAEVEKDLAGTTRDHVIGQNPRYLELCKKYDRDPIETTFPRAREVESSSSSLNGRLLNIAFYQQPSETKQMEERHEVVPKSTDIYRLKGLVARKFGLRPLSFRLVYESDLDEVMPDQVKLTKEEWDKISTSVDGNAGKMPPLSSSDLNAPPLLKKKEIELVNSTRELSYFIEDNAHEIKIRVEDE